MRSTIIRSLPLVSAALLMVAGCGGGGSSGGGGDKPLGTNASPGAVESARQAVQTVVTQAQQVVKTVEATAQKAQAAAVKATEEAQVLLDQAKSLLAEKKVQDAAGALNKLAGMTLSAEQQQLLSTLTSEVKRLGTELERGFVDLKKSVAEKNYAGATALVSKLGSYQLSPEQQKLLEDLKAQVNKLVSSQAQQEGTKAVNNLLQGR